MAAEPPIYLDGHATTPLATEAAVAMAPWWDVLAANAHSPHGAGQRAAVAVEQARSQVANLVGVAAEEVVFTSGATEANALALLGVARTAKATEDPRRRIVVSAIEHKSVLECAARLGREGFDIAVAPVHSSGSVDLEALAHLVNYDTLMVSVMAANNEVGVMQPLDAVIALAQNANALVHVDASQQAGKVALDLSSADFASLSSHKMYGPIGVGALIVSSAAAYQPEPLFAGGGQERGIRPGTLPVPLIVGFGEAARIALATLDRTAAHSRDLADQLVLSLLDHKLFFEINCLDSIRLPGSLSLRFPGCDAASLIARLSPVASIAEGSACTSGQIMPSHVLTAMGRSPKEAMETVRLFCGRGLTYDDISVVANAIAEAVAKEAIANWTSGPVAWPHEK